MIETITYKEKTYPAFQSIGNAMQFCTPYANHVCNGIGVDVGCNKKEWIYRGDIYNSLNDKSYENWLAHSHDKTGSFPIDPIINEYDALNFPKYCKNLDYIISSHCLEHVYDWVDVLDYWCSKLKIGGVLFLYLPDYSQEYWKPWNNRKHLNIFTSEIIKDYMKDRGFHKIFYSQTDLNNSFMIFGEKFK